VSIKVWANYYCKKCEYPWWHVFDHPFFFDFNSRYARRCPKCGRVLNPTSTEGLEQFDAYDHG
jgi:hypothetical protein